MEIDNFERIYPFLKFKNKDSFYFCEILQRKSDGNNVHGRNRRRRIKSFYVYSVEQLSALKETIVNLCKINNARAYISIVPKNAKEVVLTCIQEYAKLVYNDTSHLGSSVWDSVCGSSKETNYYNTYVVDLDTKNEEVFNKVQTILLSTRGKPVIDLILPTKNGFHFIAHGFDTNEFQRAVTKELGLSISLQKNNLTLLYCFINGN